MVIDLILDRKDGQPYNARKFYNNVCEYGEVDIANAMDEGEEDEVKHELCKYVIDNKYNHNICQYITSVNWL